MDLQGFGDITAGAKLAKELSQFYSRTNTGKDVQVHLHLQRIDNLERSTGKEREIDTVRSMTLGLLKGSSVKLMEKAPTNLPHVRLDYPVHSKEGTGVDVSVMQYGHSRFSDLPNRWGSGPGYGSLGVLGVSEKRQRQAIKGFDRPDSQSLIYNVKAGLCTLRTACHQRTGAPPAQSAPER